MKNKEVKGVKGVKDGSFKNCYHSRDCEESRSGSYLQDIRL
jgi:hypothetical protein